MFSISLNGIINSETPGTVDSPEMKGYTRHSGFRHYSLASF